jgi:hypothetical protein
VQIISWFWEQTEMQSVAAAIVLLAFLGSIGARGTDDLSVWKDFSRAFRDGNITADRIRPILEPLRAPMLEFITAIREQAKPEDWEQPPEIHRVGNQIHFLIPLTVNEGKKTFCFTVVDEGGTWFFQHMESITIRLDQLGSLPASRFPDVSNEQKNWMRQEIAVTERVRLFNFLVKEKGKAFALDWFKDGPGYFLAARTWVPFVPAERAFILYACWEQSNLRGQAVTLISLDDRQGVVEIDPVHLKLYEQTGHLRHDISREDYRALYETVWQDRAAAAGWDLRIQYTGGRVRFRFRRGLDPHTRR